MYYNVYMTKTHKNKIDLHIRNAFLVMGAVLILAGTGESIQAQLTDQGATVMQPGIGVETFVQGFALHYAGDEPDVTIGGMMALGSLLVFIGLGFHAYTHLPNDRHVKIRRAPSFEKKKGRSRRSREVIWIEKVFKL